MINAAPGRKASFYEKYIKRLLDILLSSLGIVVLSPLFLCIAMAVWADEPRQPVLFRQERFGRYRKPFTMIKFRTMHSNGGGDPQVTRIGRFLRRTSLDELPQLFHVWTGKMSLVGPRPLILAEENVIQARERYGANDLRPGLTGWAQIHGRNTLGPEEKACYDGEYAARISFLFDCRCLLITVGKVLRQENVGDV
ncbi:MAG: sugar transferase [Oscillospiraceae bacterium]|nr:sugar transferase [Oscillospiraceae bacterium]